MLGVSDVEGDLILHEYGGTGGWKGKHQPLYRKEKESRPKAFTDKVPPGFKPCLVTVWACSLMQWGSKTDMLTSKWKATEQVLRQVALR
jgi:hypothetical protein